MGVVSRRIRIGFLPNAKEVIKVNGRKRIVKSGRWTYKMDALVSLVNYVPFPRITIENSWRQQIRRVMERIPRCVRCLFGKNPMTLFFRFVFVCWIWIWNLGFHCCLFENDNCRACRWFVNYWFRFDCGLLAISSYFWSHTEILNFFRSNFLF